MSRQRHYQPITSKKVKQVPQTKMLRRTNFFSKRELAELPHVLVHGEQVLAIISGTYTAGTAILCVTSHRLLLIDKKMIRLSLEDIRFESIREVHYSHQPLVASMKLYYGGREMQFKTWYKNELRMLSQLVQQKMFEVRERTNEKNTSLTQVGAEHKMYQPEVDSYTENTPQQVEVLTSQLQPLDSTASLEDSAAVNSSQNHSEQYMTQQLQKLRKANSFVDRLRMSTKAGRHVLRIEMFNDQVYR